jgi:hypothetical protein
MTLPQIGISKRLACSDDGVPLDSYCCYFNIILSCLAAAGR